MSDSASVFGFAGSVALLTNWGAVRLHQLARVLLHRDGGEVPLVLYDSGPGDRVPLAGLDVEPDARFDWTDVVIGRYEYPVRDRAEKAVYTVRVRCTPETRFVTDSGDVAAKELQGRAIVRFDGAEWDTFTVPEVTPVVLSTPHALYRPRFSADACLVGEDARVCALVRT